MQRRIYELNAQEKIIKKRIKDALEKAGSYCKRKKNTHAGISPYMIPA
jgi:hypothetical protein